MVTPARAIAALRSESAFAVLARANALEAAGRQVINLGIGQPDFRTPEHIVEAAVRALRDGHHGYTPPGGIAPLREAVAGDLAARLNVTVDPALVLVVPGGKVTMFFAVLMLGEPGAEILYPDPGFPIYRSLIDYSGATAVPLPLPESQGFGFTADQVLSRVTPATRLIILNSPANPTGGVSPADEIARLAEGLAAFPQAAVLSDEIYSRMLYDGRAHSSPLQHEALRDRVILLDGWSKTYAMTGWRLGYGVWPKTLIEGATHLAINSHSCVNAAAQHAGLAALRGPQSPVDQMMAAFESRRRLLVDMLNRLPGVSCIEPGGAFYAFPNITGTGLTSTALQDRLLDEAGVATLSGTGFGAQGEGYLRLSYANSEANIREAMERFRALLER